METAWLRRSEDMLLHLARYSGEAEQTEATAQLKPAIVFLDIASFTPLTEIDGDSFRGVVTEGVHSGGPESFPGVAPFPAARNVW